MEGKLAFVSRMTSVEAAVEAGAEEQGNQAGQESGCLRDCTQISFFPPCVSSGNKNNFSLN